MDDRYSSPEWNLDDWMSAWNIGVGSVYRCTQCGNMVIVVKGGTGTLEPRCHGAPMAPAEKPR
jgi:desulfoferrodoxin-like iron-binding protein